MKNYVLTLAAVATFGIAVPVAAHHSAAIFDFRSPKTLTGTVKAIKVVNPHTHMIVTITDAKGTRDWDFEGHSASNFYRAGYNRGSVKAGDTIKITFAPMRDGADGGYIVAFTTPAGDTVGFAPPG
ncbi:hypothetical protein GRI89_01590 [Altererythrobacter salegens]|uniref:Copper-binding protein n=1 Tax=Croceibacterium salegens TaxID=1737568 RepID=A0A6I4STB2_9SPHN|nr:DUF6152 family protein [Croceibacterium salegens]MXO58237.1 hypothetical protein [Croceibacterium salegens]